MWVDEDQIERDSITDERPIDRSDAREGATFLALALLLCALFWFSVYMLAGGPLP